MGFGEPGVFGGILDRVASVDAQNDVGTPDQSNSGGSRARPGSQLLQLGVG
jgi:hypothetical protein